MSKEKKEETPVIKMEGNDSENTPVNEEQAINEFERGNLTLVCDSCGNTQVLEVGVKNGIRFVLPTVEGAEIKIVCEKCNNSIKLMFTESNEEEIKIGEENDRKRLEEQEKKKEEIEKQVKEAMEKENELLKEDSSEKGENEVVQEKDKEE